MQANNWTKYDEDFKNSLVSLHQNGKIQGSTLLTISCQHTFHLGVGNGQACLPADLFLRFIDASDHSQLQASAGGGVGDSIVQPHEVHGPASDVHKEHRGFSPY